MREIVCVSLFNGMGGAFMALEMSGFNVVQKISSEVDKYAMKANDAMFPDTIQLGDVSKIEVLKVDGKSVGLKNDKGIEVFFKEGIEIIVCGGSPCQSFSFSGKRKGMATKDEQEILTLDHYLKLKSEDYEFEGQSYLFWEFVRLRDEINPSYWFLENVEMGEKWEKVLSKAVGVNGIHVNSALLSAQNRKRIYWFNFGMEPMGLFGELGSIVEQPKDKGILLKDILEEDVNEKYYLSDRTISRLNIGSLKNARQISFGMSGVENNKATSVLARDYKGIPGKQGFNVVIQERGCIRFGRTDEAKQIRKENMKNGKDYTPFQAKEIIGIDYDKMNTLTTASNKDNLIMQLNPSKESGGKQPYQQNRIYDVDGISPALCAFKSDLIIKVKGEDVFAADYRSDEGLRIRKNGKAPTLTRGAETSGTQYNSLAIINSRIRRLTPKEAMRLQTIPDNHINTMLNCGVSDSQLYRMIGNGWTIEVISYLFNYIHK